MYSFFDLFKQIDAAKEKEIQELFSSDSSFELDEILMRLIYNKTDRRWWVHAVDR